MKRRDVIKHLLKEGCVFIREGGRHSIFFNLSLRKTSSLPRHNEIHKELAEKICKDLGIAIIKKK